MLKFSKTPPVPIVQVVKKLRGVLDYAKKKAFPAPVALLEMATGHWLASAVHVAAELDIAGALQEGELSVEEIAIRVSADANSLYRLLRTLAAAGVFKEMRPRVFALNSLARPLLRDAPDSVRGMCLLGGRGFHWDAWGSLRHSVRTGQSALEHQRGKNLFEYLAAHPEDNRVFNEAMTGWASQSAAAVDAIIDFSRFRRVADIGGGNGNFLGRLLLSNAGLKGLLFDQAHVIAGAGEVLTRLGITDRCEQVAGSFFETLPMSTAIGPDAFILKNIIHDWQDSKAVTILSRVAACMSDKSILFIVESVIPEGNEFHPGKLIDLEMLVMTPGGKERTLAEFETLCSQAGLEIVKVHATAAIESVVEIRKPISV